MDITFHGLSAHATKPHASKDALAMGVMAYVNMQAVLQRQIAPGQTYVCSVGSLQAGDVHNVIPSMANLKVSVRAHTLSLLAELIGKIRACCEGAALLFGGTVDIKDEISAYATVNDASLSELFYQSAAQVLGNEKVLKLEPRLSSDDFSWFTSAKPGLYYWVGTRNLDKWPEKALHNNDFMVDEDSLSVGARVMLHYLESLAHVHNKTTRLHKGTGGDA
jgi:amidohydrolase